METHSHRFPPGAAKSVSQPAAKHCTTELIEQLIEVGSKSGGALKVATTDAQLLATITANADSSAAAMTLGVAALGSLIAYSAPELEDRSISSDNVEALGWLIAELGALTAFCVEVSMLCRQATAARSQKAAE